MKNQEHQERQPKPTSLLGINQLTPENIRALLASAADAAINFPDNRPLTGRIIANLFFEDSTRTRLSFTIAAQRLGATTADLTTAGSSISKGETLADTIKTTDAMRPDLIVIRHKEAGAPAIADRIAQAPIINAGDGKHEHPTQALIDALTLAESLDLINLNTNTNQPTNPTTFNFTGKHIAIVGDIISSRVARSTTAILTALGAQITLVGPPHFAPPTLTSTAHPNAPESLRPKTSTNLDETLPNADAVIMLRVQFERHAEPQTDHVAGTPTTQPTPKLASPRDYAADYQLTPKRAATLAANRPHKNKNNPPPILHPGPMNRGLEIHPQTADSNQSRIQRQVQLGIPVRAAVMLRSLNMNNN